MKVTFFHVGVKNPDWLSEILDDYDKRLSRHFKVERRLIKSPAIDRENADQKKSKEAKAIIDATKHLGALILLDEKGRGFKDSREFSDKIQKLLESGAGEIGFLIGGAYGVADEIKALARDKWRLSELTFNHHLAQLVLTEQIYRALAILKNLPYHND